MFEIKFTTDAIEDLRWFKKAERKRIIAALEVALRYEPAVETRNRKRLRANQLAEWELRAGKLRIFFDIDPKNRLIKVEAVGYKKGNRLFIHGEEYEL